MRNLRAGCVATLLFMLAAAWPSNAMATQVNASVVIRVEHVGGFVGPNFASARLPDVVLYSDGSVLAPNNQDGSVRHMFVRTISKAVLQSELSAFTQVTKTPTGGWGIPSVSDLPSTEVSITQNGKVSVVDVYDALSNKRHYKDAWPEEKVIEILKEGRGSHFDPQILDLFMANLDTMLAILAANPDDHSVQEP